MIDNICRYWRGYSGHLPEGLLLVTSALTHIRNFLKALNTCGLKLFQEKRKVIEYRK